MNSCVQISRATMKNGGHRMVIGCLLILAASGCLLPSQHENFILTMRSDIGKRVGDSTLSGWMQPGRLIGQKTLSNGNTENAYRFRGDCRYFYEIDLKTQTIVGWRFEGSERDCAIPH